MLYLGCPSGAAKPSATVTVKVPAPRSTVTVHVPAPGPTVTVSATRPDSSGVYPALGQVGAFMLGLGTIGLGVAALIALRRRADNKAPEPTTGDGA